MALQSLSADPPRISEAGSMEFLQRPKCALLSRVWHKSTVFICAYLSFSFSGAAAEILEQKPLVIVIPSYNNKDWYQYNLESVLKQEYENFRVIYLDDASTDETGRLVREYLADKDVKNRVTLIENEERVGALANIYRAVWRCSPAEIVVTVDGDDWLSHEFVLQRINEAYADPDVWMTYGQFNTFPEGLGFGAQPLPEWVIQEGSFRSYDWVTTHLRTFYAGLFQKINKEDLLYKDRFFPVTWDLGFMFPMLEMSGTHSRFIPHVLYIYNVATPLSDNKLQRELQQTLETFIRKQKRYNPIVLHK
jgi:glycosyltransferase involved in cell wall biosynthesis